MGKTQVHDLCRILFSVVVTIIQIKQRNLKTSLNLIQYIAVPLSCHNNPLTGQCFNAILVYKESFNHFSSNNVFFIESYFRIVIIHLLHNGEGFISQRKIVFPEGIARLCFFFLGGGISSYFLNIYGMNFYYTEQHTIIQTSSFNSFSLFKTIKCPVR